MDKSAPHSKRQPEKAQRQRDPRRNRRRRAVCLLTLTGSGLGLLSLLPQTPSLVWNVSPSVPVGLYRVSRETPVKGNLIAIAPAGAARQALTAYGVLPHDKLLLKQLAAGRGDVVCRRDASITINGANAAIARLHSDDGRALPVWAGCRALGADDVFVLAPHPLSFDGRYFGPINASQIIGVATPLLTLRQEGAP